MGSISQNIQFQSLTNNKQPPFYMIEGPSFKYDKKKRFSQYKPTSDYKLSYSVKKNAFTHQRSASLSKNKKIRLNTDYADYEYSYNHLKNTTKKISQTPSNQRRRQTFAIQISKNIGKEVGTRSTKNDQKKNSQLRGLFKNQFQYQSKIKSKKSKAANHNISNFIITKPDKKQSYVSPYTKQIARFQSSYNHNASVSKEKYSTKNQQKRQRQSDYRSNSKSRTSHPNNISLKKDCIKIDISKNKISHSNKPTIKIPKEDESTVKTIKKKSQDFFNKSHFHEIQPTSDRFQNLSDASEDGYGLTQEEQQTFGDRFPYGFQKVKLLGRGGFSLVWLGKHIKSGKHFAIKQIITNNTHQTHIKEIWFGTMFFTLGGVPKPQFVSFPGIKNLVRLYSYQINQTDTWIFYQKCGGSLGSSLYDIKSQKVYGDDRLYKIFYKPIYQAMEKNPVILKSIVTQICKSLVLLSECEVVHSDLKTENILLKFDEKQNFKISQLKLIDYGSSFQFKNIAQFSMATPEYMPPEILNYIIHQNQGDYQEDLYKQVMENYKRPWAVDIWSLGCVLLQIIVGVPLWMSLPLLVPSKTSKAYLQKQGLFAVKGRLFPQIIAKQRSIVKKLDQVLQKDNYSRIVPSPNLKKALKGMLEIDFNKRISPQQIIDLLAKQ